MRRPASTYRVQLTPRFGFRDLADIVPYLSELGITDVYISPPFSAAPDSQHGYDVVDHNTLNPELGGVEGFEALCKKVREHGMGQLVDFVPNHMGIGPRNAWWMDVLENGPSSVYAPFFDVDWKPVKDELENRVLVPVLGDQYGDVLERGELQLVREGGTFLLAYWEHRFPIAPRSIPRLLTFRIDDLKADLGEQDLGLQELLSIVTALEKLAPRHEVDREKVAERAREKEVAKRRLAALFDSSPRIRDYVDENLRIFNGDKSDPRSFDLLDALLDQQAYRLAHWRVAGEEINYRRFFDVNTLAAIRMEDERVFEETHRLVFELLAAGKIDGLRIDHPDGLYRPSAYFARLQERVPGLYVVVEKILEGHERMPVSWRVDGTTGYEFLACANGLFVDSDQAQAFDDLYARFRGERIRWSELVYSAKRALVRSAMASEMNVLAHQLNRLSEANRRTRDFTLNALSNALTEYVARLPIYRTYVEGASEDAIETRDRQYIERTVYSAKRASKELNRSIFDFLRDVLLLRHPTPDSLEFVRKLQQVTPPVTAKAIEDTAFYRFHRLLSLNDVGSDPQAFGCTREELHRLAQERLTRWPGSLNTTSTHDTKRAEDVRLRIDALSEIPVEWEQRIHRWAQLNQPHRATLEDEPAPSANDELMVYQTLVGTYDGVDETYLQRLDAYFEKAIREAKAHSSWTNPDEPYESAVKAFARAALGSRPFLDDFEPFARRIAQAARVSALSLCALKVASPGVPDVYQGCELEDLSLVDPDNRRPVDWARRRKLTDELKRKLAEDRLALARQTAKALHDGRAKLLTLRESLRWRREDPELFLKGSYTPLAADGPLEKHVVAFAREHEGRRLVCAVPRLTLTLGERNAPWQGRLSVPAGEWVDLITGVRRRGGLIELAELFADFPVALLRNPT
jgi:(1->4)-alpha-D-glucan 1-alpha-D-glucosylmutase